MIDNEDIMPDHKTSLIKEGAVAPTLEDVSRLAGVSTATISRCLNAPQKVSEKTREKVLKAVDALGYAPNFGAQALAAKRTNTFGAIIPTMENAIFARALQAFQKELEAQGITLLVGCSDYKPDMEEKQIRALVSRGADALLLIGHNRSNSVYDFLSARDIPYINAWVHDTEFEHPSIGFDNKMAMKQLTQEVLRLGHRNIGYITAERAHNDRALKRYEGVLEALNEGGLDPECLKTVELSYSIENGAKGFETLMQDETPSAVLCGNDVLAAGAIMQAHKMGLRVPEDISIVGFDDIDIAEIVSPALTTVHVPHREMGRKCALALIERRNNSEQNSHLQMQQIELKAAIKWRNSLIAVNSTH